MTEAFADSYRAVKYYNAISSAQGTVGADRTGMSFAMCYSTDSGVTKCIYPYYWRQGANFGDKSCGVLADQTANSVPTAEMSFVISPTSREMTQWVVKPEFCPGTVDKVIYRSSSQFSTLSFDVAGRDFAPPSTVQTGVGGPFVPTVSEMIAARYPVNDPTDSVNQKGQCFCDKWNLDSDRGNGQ